MTRTRLQANRWTRCLRASVILMTGWTLTPAWAEAADGPAPAEEQLTGTIYQAGSDFSKVLFKYRRVAKLSGEMLKVVQEYDYPDGQPAAKESIVYRNGRLVSFELEELQTGASGKAIIQGGGRSERLMLTWLTGDGDKKQDDETVRPNTIVNDSIPDFLRRNWAALTKGRTVSSRFIAISRAETVGFEFERMRETVWRGKAAVVIRMKPSSFFIAALVNPLFFTVEAEGQHRVLSYTGRTTPKIMVDGKWKDLEAVTVFDL